LAQSKTCSDRLPSKDSVFASWHLCPIALLFTMRILIVEDDAKIASFLSKGLKESGFVSDIATNGTDGLHLALTETYDAAVLDLMLPGLDGLSLLARMRSSRIKTPVLILSAKRSVDDRVKGLQAGGDDYMVKPFAFSELLARLHSLIRRSSGTSEVSQLSYADLKVDLLKREVSRNGTKVYLQAKEFSLLDYLLRNAEHIVTKTTILEQVYDYNFDPQTNVVDVLVCRLRNKIDKDFSPKLIHTVRGMGYVLRRE